MKIAVFCIKSEIPEDLQKRLSLCGSVVYNPSSDEQPIEKLIEIASGADIIAIDPDFGGFGGFEKAKDKVTEVLKTVPNLKALCLDTTSYGWIDLDYCRSRNLPVSNVPGFSRESVAEHALAMLLGISKRIFVTDRRTQKGQYKLEMGYELKGKALGIIGLGNIGSRMAELGLGIGMKVIAYNRSSKKQNGVEMKSLDEVLSESDAISLHVADAPELKEMINKNAISKMKNNVIVINTVDRELVNENDMADALKSGKVFGYGLEAEDLESGPLAKVENAILFKGFGWYTKEALEKLFEIFVNNIISTASGKPQNIIN